MDKKTYYSILSKIEVIEKTDKLLRDMKTVEDEPLYVPLYNSYAKRKWDLTEELLKEMMNARLSYRQFEGLYKKLFSFLYAGENEVIIAEDLEANVNRAEQFLVRIP